jgi:RND family efflux transporter MFP subunit
MNGRLAVKRKTLILSAAAVVFVIGAGSMASIGVGAVARNPSDPRQGSQLVQTAIAKPSERIERSFTGIVTARVQSNLGFRVPGKVIERLVDVGQMVRAGQPLMRLDQTDFDLALKAKENAVVAARALAIQAAADEPRYRKLLADGWTTQQKYDQAKAVRDNTQAQLAAAEAQANLARDDMTYTVLLADSDGTVIETLAEPGQVVTAGQPVIRVAHAGPREAAVNLPETLRPAIGSLAQAQIYGAPSIPLPAHLRQLSDAADPLTRTYEARYVLEAEASRAPLGATVTLRLAVDAANVAAEVPLGALYDNGLTTGVWVVDTTSLSVAFRAVQVRRLKEESAVVSGIQIGERVVALGSHLLHQGEVVRIVEQKVAAQ